MNPSRRSLLRAAGATGIVSATGLPLAVHAQAPITVGVIYVGPRDDFGYNQAQAQAAAILKKMPGVKVVEEEKVPETVAVQKTMEAMINQDKASRPTASIPRTSGRFSAISTVRSMWPVWSQVT